MTAIFFDIKGFRFQVLQSTFSLVIFPDLWLTRLLYLYRVKVLCIFYYAALTSKGHYFTKICYKLGDTIIYNFLKALGCILLDTNTVDCM